MAAPAAQPRGTKLLRGRQRVGTGGVSLWDEDDHFIYDIVVALTSGDFGGNLELFSGSFTQIPVVGGAAADWPSGR